MVLKLLHPKKKFVEEAFEKGVEKVYIMTKPDEFYAIYLDKNGDEIKWITKFFIKMPINTIILFLI